MTEREMEDLLWEHPEKFLNEPLKQFQRQPASAVGRADIIFLDRIGRLIVIEIKRDTLDRGAINQLVDYYGMLKSQYPDKAVELMIIANRVPAERRVACQQFDIEVLEISQKKFRDVAEEVGYVFNSEAGPSKNAPVVDRPELERDHSKRTSSRLDEDFVSSPSTVEKGWYYWEGKNKRGYFLAFVNARGSCSMRRFDAEGGTFLGKEYKSGDFQESFSDYLRSASRLHVTRQPNLERDCKTQLPSFILSELRQQIQDKS